MRKLWCFFGFHRWREEFRWFERDAAQKDGYGWLRVCADCNKETA